jgi:hypothetical protein
LGNGFGTVDILPAEINVSTDQMSPIRAADPLAARARGGWCGRAVVSDRDPPPAQLRKPLWRKDISAACAAHVALGPPSLVLYDVSTLSFETDQGDQTREKSRPFQAQSLRMTVAGPHEATGKSAEQSIVSSRPPTNANP